jgi:hypothetical protein
MFMSARAKDNSGFRVHGGFGLASMTFGEIGNSAAFKDPKSRIKAGGFFGVGYEQRLVKFLAIQAEVNYVNRGGKREFTNAITNERIKLTLATHGLQIPVFLKFYIGNHFNLYAGPHIAINLAASARSKTYSANGDFVGEDKSQNVMANKYKDADGERPFKRIDVGMDFGVEGVVYKGFFVGGRITQGFIDQTLNSYNGSTNGTIIAAGDNKNVLNTSANLYAGYRF